MGLLENTGLLMKKDPIYVRSNPWPDQWLTKLKLQTEIPQNLLNFQAFQYQVEIIF